MEQLATGAVLLVALIHLYILHKNHFLERRKMLYLCGL